MRHAVVVVGLMVLASCGDVTAERGARCGDKPIAASVAPSVNSFRLVQNALRKPEGCGADFKRHLVYEGSSPDTDVLATFRERMADDGWKVTACVTDSERCFERGNWFISATVPGSGRLGYPQSIGIVPQVLAVLQRR